MKKALIVGIDNYETDPLYACINDAIEIKSILESNGDGAPNFDTRLELNIQTNSKLKSLVRDTFSGDVDTALFYFAGHGYENDLGGYLVTPDSKIDDEGFSMEELIKIVNQSEIRNKIIILDCCHSGAIAETQFLGNKISQISTGVSILTSCRKMEKSYEINGHGIFY